MIEVLEYWFQPELRWERSIGEVRVVSLQLQRYFCNFGSWNDEAPTPPREKWFASLVTSCIRRHSDVTVPLSLAEVEVVDILTHFSSERPVPGEQIEHRPNCRPAQLHRGPSGGDPHVCSRFSVC